MPPMSPAAGAGPVVTFGEGMIRLTPPRNERLERTISLDLTIGGAELNTAVTIACLGLPVTWVSALPDNALISRFAHDAAQHDDRARQLKASLTAHDEAIAATKAELAQLSSAGAMPGRNDLVAARQQRDDHFTKLRDTLDGDRAVRDQGFADVVQTSRNIDSITDLLLSDSPRATSRAEMAWREG